MNVLEQFLQDAKKDNVINSAMLEKLSYRIQFYKKELKQGQSLPIDSVGVPFVITEYAQEKLDFILGHSTTRDFPKGQPTKEWAGAVLDFLEITELLK